MLVFLEKRPNLYALTLQIFSFSSTSFFPIDAALFGNEGDDHNRYFTYEVHSYLNYNGGEVFVFQVSSLLLIQPESL